MSNARLLIARLAISLGLAAIGTSAAAASFVDPAHRYRTLHTAHFSIHFHQGEDAIARRLAVIAEDVWQALRAPLGAPPPPHTDVVLADQADLSNGFATPLPYNTVMVTAVWPAASEFLGRTDDWLRLVFTHEFTHIVHLDRSEGWARVARGIFGRSPFAFPNLFLPQWQIEGLATYEESRLTGGGRLHAGDFRTVVEEAARAGRLEPLGRLNGGLTDWPGGNGSYAYGAGFHAYLAERYGDDSLASLADATARRVPFTASPAFERVYGRSLGDLWRDYQTNLTARVPPAAGEPSEARRLTHHGFVVGGPRFDGSCATCPPAIIYSVRTPHEFPALYELPPDRSEPRRLATRYLGSTSAVTTSTVYFDQQELRRNTSLYGDLYALDRQTGRTTALTREARLLDPDLSPDGTTLVAARNAPGRRDLVLVATKDGTVATLVSDTDTQFNAPRWSPDGRTVAVEHHRLGHQSEIALVDVETRAVRTLASDGVARFVTPAWRPDGHGVVAAADFGEGAFNLYEISIDGPASGRPRQLTHLTGGATWPDISADGRTLVFVGYTVDGFDLFEMPYPAAGAAVDAGPGVRDGRPAAASEAGTVPAAGGDRYNPARTLKPTSWSPVIVWDQRQIRVGAVTAAADVLGYHGYSGSATYLAGAPSDSVPPGSPRFDWQLSYVYDRWQPTFWVSGSATTSFSAGPADTAGRPVTAALRERQLEAGVFVPFRRVRVSQRLMTAVVRGADELSLPDRLVTWSRTAWRGGWAIDSSHRYGYSISREDGVAAGLTAEVSRQDAAASAAATAVTADGRFYGSPFARHHVLAVRLAGGVSTGDPTVRKTFHLGGSQPNTETLDFGREAISLLRGFGLDAFAGSRVALLNADYRWPIARPQRGVGTWPVFLHTAHAAVFADIGHAWSGEFRGRDLKTAIGGELSIDLVAGYSWPLTLTLGAAWGRDGAASRAQGSSAYVRLGRAF